jgi:type I restriction enzyme M protein
MNTQEVLDKIFKDPKTKYELTEFENLGKPVHEILTIEPKTITSGRETGKIKYFAKSFVPFPSGKEEAQVYVEDGKSAPEEIIRQLWIYKLIHQYDYREDEIELEKSIQFGTEVSTKAADIVVYTDSSKTTPKIIIETKKPKRKDGIEQLKSYLNAEGSPVGVWSNGSDSIILYRPYPKEFDDTLFDIPRRDQVPKDVLEARRTLGHLKTAFNFKSIVSNMEELALANYGDGVFDEIFKLIFAKIFDEIKAEERPNKEVLFSKSEDPEITYSNINKLFQQACEKWPGVFKNNDKIELKPTQLSVCIGEMVGVKLMGSNLRIMDDAFEYLIPSALKKKDGQFFTPRHVIDMCVRMLNPQGKEYILDPACGSAGFLLHAMDWCYPADTPDKREKRKHKYASKYLWGIDISEKSARTSRALMLIAGDGHTNIFGPRISSLDPAEWLEVRTGRLLLESLRNEKLLQVMPDPDININSSEEAWEFYENLKFDIVLTNPPFAGELTDKKMLAKYDLAKPALKRSKDKQAKEERDRIFIERILKCLKPGGRAAIVLPQGIFNNSSLAYIREWILRKARLLAVVGLHQNTFKPHTGTKTSVLFVQKYTPAQLEEIGKVEQAVAGSCPDYETQIQKLIKQYENQADVPEDKIPENIAELLLERFGEEEVEPTETEDIDGTEDGEAEEALELEELIEKAQEKIFNLRKDILKAKGKLEDLTSQQEAQSWSETKKALNTHLKPIKASQKKTLKELNESQKEKSKKFKAVIKALDKAIPEAEIELKLFTNKGKLQLILEDPDLIATLKERFIDRKIAKKLDYPIFMAVSERGGKNTSGAYEYIINSEGNLEFDENYHPIIDQDLVNYKLTYDDLKNVANIPDEQLCISEAFVRFAQKNKFNFWGIS